MPPTVPADPTPDPTPDSGTLDSGTLHSGALHSEATHAGIPGPGQQAPEGLEAACRRSLSRLRRRPAPERLRRAVLTAAWVSSAAGVVPSGAVGSLASDRGSALRRSPALRAGSEPRGGWGLRVAAAALLLLSLGLATSRVPPSAAAGACLAAAGGPSPAPRSFAVVDDPSVPLFHDVETFDRLAVALPGPAAR